MSMHVQRKLILTNNQPPTCSTNNVLTYKTCNVQIYTSTSLVTKPLGDEAKTFTYYVHVYDEA